MDVGFAEVVVLVVLALLIFGPERLPEMARNAGQMIGKFKREAAAALDDLKRAAEVDELHEVARDVRSVAKDLRQTVDDAAAATTDTPARRRPAAPTPYDPDAT